MKGRQNNRVADSIYYSLYHDKNVTVYTLLYAQLLYKLFHCKILLCLKKERLNIPTMFADFFICARALNANSGSVHPNTRRDLWYFITFYSNIVFHLLPRKIHLSVTTVLSRYQFVTSKHIPVNKIDRENSDKNIYLEVVTFEKLSKELNMFLLLRTTVICTVVYRSIMKLSFIASVVASCNTIFFSAPRFSKSRKKIRKN